MKLLCLMVLAFVLLLANTVDVFAQLVFSTELKPRTFQVTQSASGETNVYDIASGIHYSQTRMFWEATWSTVHPSVMPEGAASGDGPALTPRGCCSTARDCGRDGHERQVLQSVWRRSQNLDGASAYHLRFAVETIRSHIHGRIHLHKIIFNPQNRCSVQKMRRVTSGDTGPITLNFRRIGSFWMVKSGQVTARAHDCVRMLQARHRLHCRM